MNNNFDCDACWMAACLRARSTDGNAAAWYRTYHADAHKRQGLQEIRS